VARCALRGSGDVRYAAVVGVVTAWLCTPTFAWVLGHHLRLGAFGGWLGLCVEIVISSAVLWTRLEKRGWLPIAQLSRARLSVIDRVLGLAERHSVHAVLCAGDLFDGTEIDEILSLRIMTLTDEEKREMETSDARARQILERTEAMPVEQFMKLHGVMRR